MKISGKRLLGLLLAVMLLLGTMPGSAVAVAGSVYQPAPEGGFVSDMLTTEDLDLAAGAAMQAARAGGYGGADLYSQLNARQKVCFDLMANTGVDRIIAASAVEDNERSYHRVIDQVEGITNTILSGRYVDKKFYADASAKTLESGIYTDLLAAIIALRYDRPDIFWTTHMRYGYKVEQVNATTAKVTGVMIDYHMSFEGKEKSMQEAMLKNAKYIADQAVLEEDTYNRVKKAHDMLCTSCIYGDSKVTVNHTAYSALVSGDEYDPVCDGYAKAFKIICDYMDIPCVTASSADHMWNNVKMDDGKWYNIDLTFDDQNARVNYDYFLVGSNTRFADVPFSSQPNHVERNPFQTPYEADASGSLKMVAFRFPAKSAEKYEYQGQDYDPPAFPDVSRSDWFYDSVETACGLGLFKGEDGLFLPRRNITRAEFALVLARAMGEEGNLSLYSGYAQYPDSVNHWAADAISWVTAMGYMKGDEKGFRPEDPINREELCITLIRALGYEAESTDFRFKDDAKISSWAKAAVYECYLLDIVKGDEYGFRPKDFTPRCEAVALFTRFAHLIGRV